MTAKELKQTIIAEIERRLKVYRNTEHRIDPNRIDEDESLLSFIDSLPDEKPEPEICSRCTYHHKDDGYCYEPHGGKSSWINENGVYKCTGFDPLSDELVDADAAMKELDEKIKLTKEHGSWKGVDVDEFMDEVRGRDTDGLEEEIQKYMSERWEFGCINPTTPVYLYNFTTDDLKEIAHHFAEWQYQKDRGEFAKIKAKTWSEGFDDCKEQMMKGAVEGKVYMSFAPGHDQMVMADVDLPTNTKVKLIIIPQDDETN